MEKPLISVIVPVYKVENYLHNCIKSVLSQSHSNLELILVNDGSPDGCPQICDEYSQKDRRVKVLHMQNGGVARARNAALDICEGEFITFLDGDDFWHIDYLTKLLQLALNHSADIVQCGFIRGTAVVFPEVEDKRKTEILNNRSVFVKGYANVIVCAKLYHRNVLDGLRMPAGKYFEDDFTTWKWYYKASVTVVTSERLYYYTANQQSTMANHSAAPRLDFIDAYDERIGFFQETGERDLEDCSRAHLCKSMVLSSLNKNLSPAQKNTIKHTFAENWKEVKSSRFVSFPLKALFTVYSAVPELTGAILRKVYKA